MFIKKKQSGYTIAEMLVVMAIMVMMLGVSTASYRVYQNGVQVKSAAKGVRSFLWEAQSRALAPSNKDATAYVVSLSKGAPGSQTVGLDEEVASTRTSVATLNFIPNLPNSYIFEIKVDGIPAQGSTMDSSVSFDINSTNASNQIKICDSSSNCSYSKIEIFLNSNLSTDQYEVIVDKNLNSISMQKVSAP